MKHRWEFRFERWHPWWGLRRPFERDCFLDGGSRFWRVGPFALYRWVIYPSNAG